MINTNYDSQVTFGKKYCLIPKCHARCCSSAPIPFRFFDRMATFNQEKFVRNVYDTIPAPQTNPYCRDAIIPITRSLDHYPLKVQKVKGKKVFVLDVGEIIKDEKNYCPFLTTYRRCNIYESRPKVCRDFGVGSFYCDDQVSGKEYYGYYWGEYKKMVRKDIQTCRNFLNEKLHLNQFRQFLKEKLHIEECKKFIKDKFSK